MADLRLGIDAGRARTGANAFNNALKKVETQTKRTSRATDKAQKSTKGMGNAFNIAKAAVGALVGALAIRSFIRFSDAAINITNRLRLVTSSSEELAIAQAQVFAQAQEARIAFEGQAELFQRVARSSSNLGKSLAETLEVTEAVAKAITISGVSADSANAAIVQLGQGLASGALRGDELRSVLEQTPRLAQAIAEGMGIAVGELRKLGMAGELTAEAVFEALQKQLPQLQKEFAGLSPTFSQAGTVLENSFIRAVGVINKATGVSESFAQLLIDTAKIIDTGIVPALIDVGNVGRIAFANIIGAIDRFLLRAELLGKSAAIAVAEAREEQGFFDKALQATAGAANAFNKELEGAFRITQILASPLQVVAAAIGGLEEGTQDVNKLLREQETILDDIGFSEEANAKIVRDAAQRRLDLQRELAATVGDDDGGAGVDPVIKATDKQLKLLAKTIADTRTPLEVFTDQLAQLEELKKIADAAENASFSQEQFNRAVQAAVDVFTAADPAYKAFNEEQERQQSIVDSLVPAQETYATQLGDLTMLLDAGRISQEQFNIALAEANDILQANDPALARQNQQRLDAIEIINSLRTNEQLLAEEEFRLNTLVRDTALSADEAAESLKRFGESLDETRSVSEEFAIQAARNIQTAFADFLFDPFEEGLRGMFSNFADTLKKIASEVLANALLNQALSFLSNLGGPIGQFASLAAGSLSGKQAGGPVGRGESVVVGERGPEVFTPRSAGSVTSNNAMESMMPTINNNVIIDPRAFTGALATPTGGRDLINAIQVNKRAVQSALQ